MKGYFRHDFDGHNYFVSASRIKEFDQLIHDMEKFDEYSEEWDELNDEFLDKFDGNCLPGSIEIYLVEIDDGELDK
jgi:hypothetical protein